ncbi:sel1 repeat family protein [Shewanella sp. Scap07]|uniref:tetratricopeptide repeat protein n=1 Tax=Shewanella sp. Scap07 TaxID=2589987 RepID=UPI0015BCE416|nr:SEL1-like repeat protein [Shewanella sp. Scap07]QLE86104.1 sel1 repeat family protein [Shewanella sp. Scap07]
MFKVYAFLVTLLLTLVTGHVNAASEYEQAIAAANEGNYKAAYQVASMLDNGRHVDEDKVAAIEWYTKSARMGYSQAQSMLGFKYAMGTGVEKDMKTAYAWFSVALSNGHEISEQYQQKAAKDLSAKELEVAKDMAEKWSAAYKVSKVD